MPGYEPKVRPARQVYPATYKLKVLAELDAADSKSERVETTLEGATLAHNGRPAAVLVNPADLEAREDALDVLHDSLTMQRLREGEAAVAAGDALEETSLRELLAHGTD